MSGSIEGVTTPEVAEFLPLHKRAFGTATGAATALLVFGVTALTLILQPEPLPPLSLLREYFAGYTVSWTGALIGAAWGAVTGFFMGWFLAFARNALVAIMIIYVRTRAEWTQTRDFLDHI